QVLILANSHTGLPALRPGLHPGCIVLGDVHCLEFCPCRNGIRARCIFLRGEELSDEINVTTVRYLLESLRSVQDNVLLDEVTISGVVSLRDLFFSPAVEAIPHTRLLANLGCGPPGLRTNEILRFAIARVVRDQ